MLNTARQLQGPGVTLQAMLVLHWVRYHRALDTWNNRTQNSDVFSALGRTHVLVTEKARVWCLA